MFYATELGASAISKPGRRHFRLAGWIFIGLLLLALLLGLITGRVYWGYWFSRPGIDPLIGRVARVETTTAFSNWPPRSVSGAQVPMPVFETDRVWVESIIRDGRASGEYPYYFLNERVLELWARQGRFVVSTGTYATTIDVQPVASPARIAQIHDRLLSDDVLESCDSGYEQLSRWLDGIVAEVVLDDGRRGVVVMLHQLEISNDHRVYHEIVFEDTGELSKAAILSHRRFFYDVAGFEHMTWCVFAIWYGGPAVAVGTLVCVPLVWMGLRERSRAKHGHCARCDYDLVGLVAESGLVTCPECGLAASRSTPCSSVQGHA
jgi:hypothetical protein